MSSLTSLPPMIGELAASASSLAAYRECPKKYELNFLRMMASEAEHAPFLIGTMVHKGLELFHGAKMHPKKIMETVTDELYARLRASFVPGEDMAALDKETSIVMGMLMGYFKHYGPAEWSNWTDVRTETGFSFRWGTETDFIPMMGMIDMIAQYKDGNVWVVEHKTTGMSSNEYLLKWHLGFQPHTYVWAAWRMYKLGMIAKPPVGCVVNVLKKPGIRRKQTETQEQFNERLTAEYIENPTKYLQREWIPIGLEDLKWYETHQGYFIKRMREDHKDGFFAQNTDACHSHFGQCRFFPICHTRGKDPGIYQYFRVKEKSFEEIPSVTATDL